MKHVFIVQDDCLRICMPEELDHHNADKIREGADVYLLSGRVKHVIFDFATTGFMDSSGIGVIVGRYKKVRCLGGKVKAVNANQRIRKMIQVSGLKNMIEIVD